METYLWHCSANKYRKRFESFNFWSVVLLLLINGGLAGTGLSHVLNIEARSCWSFAAQYHFRNHDLPLGSLTLHGAS